MTSDTKDFIRAMAASGVLRFAAPAAAVLSDPAHNEAMRVRAERKRRAAGCRVYAQPFRGLGLDRGEQERRRKESERRAKGCKVYAQRFKGKLPPRDDPGYSAAYKRLERGATPEAAAAWRAKAKEYMRKYRAAKKGKP